MVKKANNLKEKSFQGLLFFSLIFVVLIVAGFFVTLVFYSFPALREFGFKFFTSSSWNPIELKFGALPFIAGTLMTSFSAIILSVPFSLGLAFLLGEYMTRGKISRLLKTSIDLIASIPSVIYGFWGIAVIVPIVRKIEVSLGIVPYGVGIFTASLILAIMILPYSASMAIEVIKLVPSTYKEAAYSLGATKFEVLKKVIIPYSKSGILAGFMLSLGRALGETMAVTMVIGNMNFLPKSIFSPANTLASVIASEFTESTGGVHTASMILLALTLFLITGMLNVLVQLFIKKVEV